MQKFNDLVSSRNKDLKEEARGGQASAPPRAAPRAAPRAPPRAAQKRKRGGAAAGCGRQSGARKKTKAAPPTFTVSQVRDRGERLVGHLKELKATVGTKAGKSAVGAAFARPVVEMYPSLEASYLEAIPNPMDLGTVMKKVKDKKSYGDDPMLLYGDLELIYQNCMAFNVDAVQGLESRLFAEAYWVNAQELFDKKFKHLRFGPPQEEPERAPALVRLKPPAPARPRAESELMEESSSEEDAEPADEFPSRAPRRVPRKPRSRPKPSTEVKREQDMRKQFLSLAKGWKKWPDQTGAKKKQMGDLSKDLEIIVKVGRSAHVLFLERTASLRPAAC